MKATTTGIILLTILVFTRYITSVNNSTIEQGQFSKGIILDRQHAFSNFLAEQKTEKAEPVLLASNSSTKSLLVSDNYPQFQAVAENDVQPDLENIQPLGYSPVINEEPVPMEYGSTLVVFDPRNTAIAQVNYSDNEDNARPLDQGNTVISGMMSIMPRR